MSTVDTWILPSEDDPAGTNYNDPNSSYQNAITYGVYGSVDRLFICFADTVEVGDGTYTVAVSNDATHPGGLLTSQYIQWIMQDAPKANPDIEFRLTLGYSETEFSVLFAGDESTWQDQCTAYSNNVAAYLVANGYVGFDIDWEGGFAYSITQAQFKMLFSTMGPIFQAQGLKLSMCPQYTGNLDPDTVNAYFDMVTLQVYGGASRQQFIQAGVNADLLVYGAKFESIGHGDITPYQDAQQAQQAMASGSYDSVVQWRINSGDFQFEQAQQMILYQLVKGTGDSFDDGPILGAAGNPPITTLWVRHGEVVDAIQTQNTGSFTSNNYTVPLSYTLVQHGGGGGTQDEITLDPGDTLVEISGYTGVWYGWSCVLQITLTTANGRTYGPYGTMTGSTGQTPFSQVAPKGQSIVAFSGTTRTVPMAGGGQSAIVTSLTAEFG